MRQDTRRRLDAIEKQEHRRRLRSLGAVLLAVLILGGVWLGLQKSDIIETVDGVVERSAIGVDQFGQKFHTLHAKLSSGETVSVGTYSMTPLRPGTKIKIDHRQNAIGYHFYVLGS